MTLDHLDRMAAYASAPDVYDAPTPSEIKKAVDEIRKARKQERERTDYLRNKIAGLMAYEFAAAIKSDHEIADAILSLIAKEKTNDI